MQKYGYKGTQRKFYCQIEFGAHKELFKNKRKVGNKFFLEIESVLKLTKFIQKNGRMGWGRSQKIKGTEEKMS